MKKNLFSALERLSYLITGLSPHLQDQNITGQLNLQSPSDLSIAKVRKRQSELTDFSCDCALPVFFLSCILLIDEKKDCYISCF